MINSLSSSNKLEKWKVTSCLYSWVRNKVNVELKDRKRSNLNMLRRAHLSVSSNLEELSAVQQWFQTLFFRLAEDSSWLTPHFDQLNLALAEGFTNAVRHAHAGLPSSTLIDIELWSQKLSESNGEANGEAGSNETKHIEIRIFDQGDPFDPSSLSEPKPGSLREGGYGWFLLRRLADQVTYDAVGDRLVDSTPSQRNCLRRNCLRIVKTAKVV